MKNRMSTWWERAGKLTSPTKLGSPTSNWHSKKRPKRHLLSQLEKEYAPIQPRQIDTCQLASTKDKWHKTSLLKRQPTGRTPLTARLSKSLVTLLLSLRSHQNFKSLKIHKRLRRKTIWTYWIRGKGGLEKTTDGNSLSATTSPKTSRTRRSHQSN